MIMKPEELRIGNYVFYNSNKNDDFVIIDRLTIHAGFERDLINKLKPIPLTEEWLLKFGFIKKPNGVYFIQLNDDYFLEIIVNAFSGTLEKDADWFTSIYYPIPEHHITFVKQYIHQLQNLYFALTGKELEIKK